MAKHSHGLQARSTWAELCKTLDGLETWHNDGGPLHIFASLRRRGSGEVVDFTPGLSTIQAAINMVMFEGRGLLPLASLATRPAGERAVISEVAGKLVRRNNATGLGLIAPKKWDGRFTLGAVSSTYVSRWVWAVVHGSQGASLRTIGYRLEAIKKEPKQREALATLTLMDVTQGELAAWLAARERRW